MIDRVSPCWTRNMTHLPPSANTTSIINPLTIAGLNNNSSSPGGSSSVLTMESLDSLEGFESGESGFIASRPSMAELMGNVQQTQISPALQQQQHGPHSNMLNNSNNNNSLTSCSSPSSGHLTPMSLSHSSSNLMHASHPHELMMMSPSHHEATTPSTPTSGINSSMYGLPSEMGVMDGRGGMGQPQQLQPGSGGQSNGSSSSGGVNVAEYPWMKEKKTTRKNNSHGNSKSRFKLSHDIIKPSTSYKY